MFCCGYNRYGYARGRLITDAHPFACAFLQFSLRNACDYATANSRAIADTPANGLPDTSAYMDINTQIDSHSLANTPTYMDINTQADNHSLADAPAHTDINTQADSYFHADTNSYPDEHADSTNCHTANWRSIWGCYSGAWSLAVSG